MSKLVFGVQMQKFSINSGKDYHCRIWICWLKCPRVPVEFTLICFIGDCPDGERCKDLHIWHHGSGFSQMAKSDGTKRLLLELPSHLAPTSSFQVMMMMII